MAACTPNPNPNPKLVDLLQIPQRFSPSEHLMISCGCVPVDPTARKIAILRNSITETSPP